MPASQENTATVNRTQTLRQRLKQCRLAQGEVVMQQASTAICQHLADWLGALHQRQQSSGQTPARHVAAFWPLPSEPDIRPLLAHWVETQDVCVSLPAVVASDALSFRVWTPQTRMRTGAFNVQEPAPGSETTAPPDVMLVPTLGFTRQGDRLGYGKGHYDRKLTQLRAGQHIFISVGVAWACGEILEPDYAPAPHDAPLDAIVTEHGMVFPAPLQ